MRIINHKKLYKMEPFLNGNKALLSPSAGIFDVKAFVKIVSNIKKKKVNFYFNVKNLDIKKINSKFQIYLSKKIYLIML